MTRPEPLSVSVSRTMPAPAQGVYDRIADLPAMPTYSPETIDVRWLGGATGAVVGARFRGRNAIGRLRWSTSPRITVADRGVRLAFRVPGRGGPLWTFDFQAVDAGTRVTESMVQSEPSPWIFRALQRRAGVADRADHLRAGMQRTLDAVADALSAPSPVIAHVGATTSGPARMSS